MQIPKVFSDMVTSSLKPIIVDNISPFQIGGIPGHRSQEHLFTAKCFIMMMEKNSSSTAVQLLDCEKYLDS